MGSITSERHHTTGLRRFLALSALAHAALLFVAVPHPQASPAAVLRLALAREASAPAAAPRTGEAGPATSAPVKAGPGETPHPPVVSAAVHAPEAAPATPAVASSKPAPLPDTPAEKTGATAAQVIAQVRAALARYFSYPVVARRQGWEGEVLLGFSVESDGRIGHVEVVRSSGHRLLDEAARESLARVGTLPEYGGGAPLQLQLPIVYRLAEG